MYEFFRNEKLDGANFFLNRAGTNPIPGRTDRRTPLRYNQYGAAAGGPVVIPRLYNGKDRTFFFANFEITSLRRSLFRTFSVPTAAMRTGNLTRSWIRYFRPRYNHSQPWRGRSVHKNSVRESDRSQRAVSRRCALNILQLYPLPQRPGVVNNLDSVASSLDDDKQISFRVDHNFTQKYRIFGRYSRLWNDHYEPNYWNSVSSPAGFNQFIKSHTLVLDQIWTLRPTLLFNFRYGFARQRNFRDPYSLGTDLGGLGFSPLFTSQVQERFLPAINITGLNGNDETGNQRFTRYSHNVAAAVSLVRSAAQHEVRLGRAHVHRPQRQSRQSSREFQLRDKLHQRPRPCAGGPHRSGPFLGFASFLLGLPTSGNLTYTDATSQNGFYHALYFQDDWRISQKLTLNLGLRWEMETGPVERYNRIATVEPDIASPLAQQTGLPLHGGLEFRGVNGAAAQPVQNRCQQSRPTLRLRVLSHTENRLPRRHRPVLRARPRPIVQWRQSGFTVTTPFVATIDSVTPVGNFTNPFPVGLFR